MIKAIIIEDSRLARIELNELLKDFPEIGLIGEAGNAEEAIEMIRDLNPDLIFLDIHLPGKNGFEILQGLDKVPMVIFTTAYDQYALQAFEYNTMDYLLKPIAPERLGQAIAKVMSQLTKVRLTLKRDKLGLNDRIFLKDGAKCWFVTLNDVRFFESKGNYTQVHFENNSPLVLRSLQQIEDTLDDQQFIRVNRQQMVNVRFIVDVVEWFSGSLKLKLSSGETIEVSRRQVHRIKELFSL
ncbi:LytR/AlgR family response regulator transcription factor [Pedobacter caeni]|uniref:Two component transcriptional regulator, LytTR family n=1 Tax=Pedobacter caeni TaxID=288992 RepID=A0A1M5ASF5_9SPHI|nr:LytTR family DNA-binding domain-containing protein [Pedobacter caeni]SHF33169.1 two component transcriptional regulator, LytTR family [Pedobacter caeni]